MAPSFIFPQNLHSLEEEMEDSDTDSNRLIVQNPTSLTTFPPSQLEEFVKGQFFPILDTKFSFVFPIFPIVFFFLNFTIEGSHFLLQFFLIQMGSHWFLHSFNSFLILVSNFQLDSHLFLKLFQLGSHVFFF